MTPSGPPPLPPASSLPRKRSSRSVIVLPTLSVILGLIIAAPIFLRLCGLLIPYSVPSGGMSPAIERGDHLLMEGFTYLSRSPRRGDVLVFKCDGFTDLPDVQRGATYIQRLVGMPGDELRIIGGALQVNGQTMAFQNRAGVIRYVNSQIFRYLANDSQTVKVPDGYYFVLGDNSAHSADSRLNGFLSKKSVKGRAAYCYWPPARAGRIK